MFEGVITDREAVRIGAGNSVISRETVLRGWGDIINRNNGSKKGCESVSSEVDLRYSLKTLEKFLQKPEWFLIYDLGFSLKVMIGLLGSEPKQEPCHYGGNIWWLPDAGEDSYYEEGKWHFPDRREDHWVDQKREPDYYLLNTAGLYENKSWDNQQGKIESGLQRASIPLMISLGVAFFLSQGSYFQGNCSHWSSQEVSKGMRVASHFDKKGFRLFNWGEKRSEKDLAVFFIRNFDN